MRLVTMYANRSRGALGLAAITLAACTASGPGSEPDLRSDAPVDQTTADVPIVSGTASWVEVGRFEGGYDALTQHFWLNGLPASRRDDAPDGLRTVPQAVWCDVNVVNDGAPGTNPDNSIEIYSEPDSSSTDIGFCMAQNPAGNADDYPIGGVFCTNVTVRSFYLSRLLEDTYAEIDYFRGQSSQYGYPYPLGTGAPVPPGPEAPSNTYGLWSYGDLTTRGTPGAALTRQWAFRFGSTSDFAFAGRLVARVAEVCGNGVDDNCDGIADNGCATWTAGTACFEDADCVSFFCDGGFCSSDCAPGRFGPSCTPCPGGVADPCSGNGVCADGTAGNGVCTCLPNFTGAACEDCETNRWGPSCDACPGGTSVPCSGRGTCDSGIAGTGVCECDTGFGGATCTQCDAGYWGATCSACPGGSSTPCNGNGACDEGTGGTGVCTCSSGAHGAACAFTCSDGVTNGTEAGTDCGGPCTTPCGPRRWVAIGESASRPPLIRDDGRVEIMDVDGWSGDLAGHAAPGDVYVDAVGEDGWLCALRANGVVDCFGDTPAGVASTLPGGGTLDLICAASGYVCAAERGGTAMVCAGSAPSGAATLSASAGIVAMSCGEQHLCVVTAAGEVRCAGDNTVLQAPASRFPASGIYVDVEVGAQHTCALRGVGSIECWGDNTTLQAPSSVRPAAAPTSSRSMRGRSVPVPCGTMDGRSVGGSLATRSSRRQRFCPWAPLRLSMSASWARVSVWSIRTVWPFAPARR